MTPVRRTVTFRIDADVFAGLQQIWDRDGITTSEQIRRALRAWIKAKGVIEADRKRAGTRKRP